MARLGVSLVSGLAIVIALHVSHCTAACIRSTNNIGDSSKLTQAQLQEYMGIVRYAICNVLPNENLDPEIAATNNVVGRVVLRQKITDDLQINVELKGLDTNSSLLHGFHIHEFGDLTDGCDSTGSHYNPFDQDHGSPDDIIRHVGDLGNVERAANGSVSTEFTDGLASLWGEYSVVGRAMVVHADEDDLGKGGHSDSLTTGHAGARLACCVIGQVNNVAWA